MSGFPDIATAMSDPRLLGRFFAGPPWDCWRAVLRGAFALPMSPAEIEAFQAVTGRQPPARRVRELDIIAGRRSGKDSIASGIAAFTASTFRADGRTRPGERPVVLLLAADKSQARGLLAYVKGYFAEIPALAALVTRDTLDGLELSTGVDIVVSTSDFRLVRGRTVLLVILNEISFWPQDGSASPDTETVRAIMPAMATLGDDAMLIAISSAYRRSGWLYSRWQKFYGVENPDTLVVHAPTRSLNPTISQAIIDAAMADDPQSAAAEYNSEWRDDLAAYIGRDEIEAIVDAGITVRPAQSGLQYTAFIDASSGAGKDSFCCSIGHRADGDVCIVDCVVEIVPPFSPPTACATLAQALKSYRITRVTADRWGLAFVASEFERHGISLGYSDRTSSEIFRQALPIIRSGRARLVDNDRMINQFANLERRILPSGGERIGHPERGGHHDDIAVVVAGCLVALSTPLSGAEGWLEFYRRQVEEPEKFARFSTDFDDIRAAGPEFDWNFGSSPWFTILVPAPIASEGGVVVAGRFHTFNGREGRATLDAQRDAAVDLLSRPAWRALNEDLARQILGETA